MFLFVCLLCGDWVCTRVQKLRDAAIGSVLSKPDAVLFDWVLLCTNLTLCGDCMFACVLYVCLCVVCLFVCYCCYVVIGSVRGSETTGLRRLDLCSPNPTLYYFDWVLLCTNPTLCSDCMFACVLYVCLCIVCLFVCCMFAMR